jgi:hypothetical protein
MDLRALPQEEKRMINWIRRQGSCSLLDMVIHFCQDEETIFKRLFPLIARGFVVAIEDDRDEIYYQVKFASKRPREIPVELTREIDS